MTFTQSSPARRVKLLILGVVAFASMATSVAEDPILFGSLEGPTIQLTADEPIFVQHVRIVANNEAFYGVQPGGGFASVQASLSSPATGPNCDNNVVIRVIPDDPDVEPQEQRLSSLESGYLSFTTFLDCQPEQACEEGFTLEVEHDGDACALPVEISWSASAELSYPSDASISTYATIEIETD